jgi:hypothetical protein
MPATDLTGGVLRLTGQVFVSPPERPLAVDDVSEAALAQPLGQAGSGVTPPRSGHAADHRLDQRVERGCRWLGAAGGVVDFDSGDRAARDEDAACFAQDGRGIGDVLEEPHHPHVVERLVGEREGQRVGLDQRRVDSGPLEMPARELELLRLDVDAGQANAGELLPEHRQDGTNSTTHLEQARPRLELRSVADQAVSPVLRLFHQALLFGRSVAVNVGHAHS